MINIEKTQCCWLIKRSSNFKSLRFLLELKANCTFKHSSIFTAMSSTDSGTHDNGFQGQRDLLKLGQKFNKFFFEGLNDRKWKPMFCQGKPVGIVRKPVEDAIRKFHDLFDIKSDGIHVIVSDSDVPYDDISSKMLAALSELKRTHDFVALRGWRNEDYEIRSGGFDAKPLFKMERSATPMFGFRQYGVDINGYVRHPEKGLCVWLQKRSTTKPTWPGRWDSFVSGGLSVGHGILDSAIKEANEEANVPQEIAQTMTSGGSVTFLFESERGIFPNTEYVFDLELPMDFVPKNNDGEVDEFDLVTVAQLRERICNEDFKTTSCPVLLDFLVRWGYINAENEPNFVELVELLHVPIHIWLGSNLS